MLTKAAFNWSKVQWKPGILWNIIHILNNCFQFEYIFKMILISVMQSHQSVSLVSHDPSEMILVCWFAAQETFLIISVENIF